MVTKLSQDLVLQIPVTTQIRPAVDHSARRPFCPRDLKTSKISIGDLNAVSPDTFSGSGDSVTLTIERGERVRPYLVFVVITLSVINVRPIPDKCEEEHWQRGGGDVIAATWTLSSGASHP